MNLSPRGGCGAVEATFDPRIEGGSLAARLRTPTSENSETALARDVDSC
jgi:hypothetical protein